MLCHKYRVSLSYFIVEFLMFCKRTASLTSALLALCEGNLPETPVISDASRSLCRQCNEKGVANIKRRQPPNGIYKELINTISIELQTYFYNSSNSTSLDSTPIMLTMPIIPMLTNTHDGVFSGFTKMNLMWPCCLYLCIQSVRFQGTFVPNMVLFGRPLVYWSLHLTKWSFLTYHRFK